MTRYLSEVVNIEQRLEFGIHICCGALVFQSDVIRAGRSAQDPGIGEKLGSTYLMKTKSPKTLT